MPITKTANVVVETAPTNKRQFENTGVMHADQFSFCDAGDPLKQMKFDLSAMTTNTTATFKAPPASGTISLGNTLQYVAPVTTDSVTIAAGTTHLVIEPAGTIAALTVVLPTAPADGTLVQFCSTQIVTTLTLTPGGSDTVVTDTTALAVDTAIKYIYRASSSKWYKQK